MTRSEIIFRNIKWEVNPIFDIDKKKSVKIGFIVLKLTVSQMTDVTQPETRVQKFLGQTMLSNMAHGNMAFLYAGIKNMNMTHHLLKMIKYFEK